MVEVKQYRNLQGLNEILSDILGYSVSGNWLQGISSEKYLGAYKKDRVEGRIGQEWGDTLEKQACSYLSKRLEEVGWKLSSREYINGEEYDCVGWKGLQKSKQSPDLVIEMYFPKPNNEYKPRQKVVKMVRKLEKINAELKYIVFGVRRGKVTSTERPRPDIKVVFQVVPKLKVEKRGPR